MTKFDTLSDKKVDIKCGFDKSFDDSFYMGPHYHPRIEVMYNQEGEFDIEFYTDDLEGIEHYVIRPQSFVIIKPNVIHQLIINKNKTARILNLELLLSEDKASNKVGDFVFSTSFNKLALCCPSLKTYVNDDRGFMILNDDGAISKRIRDYIKVADTNSKSNETTLQKYLAMYQLIVEFLNCYSNQSKSKLGTKYINNAISYIEKNYSSKIGMEEISKASGISKYYLSRLFKSYLSKSVGDYLSEVRVEHCKSLLESTDIPICDLCKKVGFESRQALLYTFKKETGVSLQDYKKKINNSNIDLHVDKQDLDSTVEITKNKKRKIKINQA